MDYESIKFATLSVLTNCNIHSFPINCFEILKYYEIDVYPYSSLNETLKFYCMKYSDDALIYKDKICYNDNNPYGRILFSLMHELGHIILNHDINHTLKIEQEANYFASNILAPRMAIHYSGCKNQNDVANQFHLTQEASQYAFDDYKRWRRRIVYHKMNPFDKAIYSYFYNKDQEKFIYNIKHCFICDSAIYNSNQDVCPKCNHISKKYYTEHSLDTDFLVAENQWLYGDL